MKTPAKVAIVTVLAIFVLGTPVIVAAQTATQTATQGTAKTLTGTLSFKTGFITVAASGKTSILVAPGMAFSLLPLAENIQVTVEGLAYEGAGATGIDASERILVQKITISGQTYDLVAMAKAHGGMGGRGMMGGMAGAMHEYLGIDPEDFPGPNGFMRGRGRGW